MQCSTRFMKPGEVYKSRCLLFLSLLCPITKPGFACFRTSRYGVIISNSLTLSLVCLSVCFSTTSLVSCYVFNIHLGVSGCHLTHVHWRGIAFFCANLGPNDVVRFDVSLPLPVAPNCSSRWSMQICMWTYHPHLTEHSIRSVFRNQGLKTTVHSS